MRVQTARKIKEASRTPDQPVPATATQPTPSGPATKQPASPVPFALLAFGLPMVVIILLALLMR